MGDAVISDGILEIVAQKCKKLKGLFLHGNDGVTSSGLNTVLSELGDQIIYLDITYCNIPETFISKIPELCPNLHSLRSADSNFDKQSLAFLRAKIDYVDVPDACV
jgi:hypothetical protein